MEWIINIGIFAVIVVLLWGAYTLGKMDGRIEGLEMASRLLEEMFKKEQEDTDE